MQNHQTEDATYGGQSFKPFEFNARERDAEVAEGEYTVTIQSAKYRELAPEKGGYPQLNMSFKVTATATDTDDAEKSVGGTFFDSITFYPRGERARMANMNKQRYLALLEACGVDEDVLTSISGAESFDDLVEALKGKEITVWVKHTPRQDGQGVYVNCNYAAPRGVVQPEEEVEEAKPARAARAASKPTAKPAAKQATSRR